MSLAPDFSARQAQIASGQAQNRLTCNAPSPTFNVPGVWDRLSDPSPPARNAVPLLHGRCLVPVEVESYPVVPSWLADGVRDDLEVYRPEVCPLIGSALLVAPKRKTSF